MKQEFSAKWNSSKQPRKQRKYAAKAPLHLRRKIMSAHLSEDLRKKHSKRSFPVRKGDKVKVLRGQFKGTMGEIEEINRSKYRVYIKGVEIAREKGQKRRYPIHPSNLIILTLDLADRRRVEALKRK